MSKLRVLSIAFMVLALAVSIGDTYAEEYDYETGLVLSENVGEEMAEGIEPQARTISLNIPVMVENGEEFTYRIDYSPPISGKVTEKIVFKWPSRCDGFKEKTIRTKTFVTSGSSSSSDWVITPGELCVEGGFEVKAIVKKGTKRWKATATMMVINPNR